MKIFLIDGHGFCYRSFYAIRNLTNSHGEPTNVIYGFTVMLRKIIQDFKPDGLGVAFDSKGPTFRHKKFTDYKSHRKPMPDDLIAQIPGVKRLVDAFRVPIVEMPGFEADDILGTLSRRIAESGHEAVIVTGDKDLLQLVKPRVSVMNPQKDFLVYDKKEVEKYMGVKPNQIPDLLSLAGDASDYIPGVPGIGSKTAVHLIQKFGSLDRTLAHVSEVTPPSKRRAIEDNLEQAKLSRELAVIEEDVPIRLVLGDLTLQEPDRDALKKIYEECEFRSLLKTLHEGPKPKSKRRCHLITDEAAWKGCLGKIKKAREFAFDFETTSVDVMKAKPVGISFAWKPHEAYFVLFSIHRSKKSSLKSADVLESLKSVFENEDVKKVGQNIKYEMAVLRGFGIRLKGVSFDTMVGSYLLNPAKPNHNLGDLAMEHLDERLIDIEELIGKGKNQVTMDHADLEQLTEYGCQDSDVTFRLAARLNGLIREKGLLKLMTDIELPLIEVLCDMETAGVAVDEDYLAHLSEEMGEHIVKLEKQIFETSGCEFNINSPKQLGEVLFDKLKLPIIRRTKTGVSTDVDVLTQLADKHPLPKTVLEYRELAKLKSTYVDTMPELVFKNTGRVHTSFNQTVTSTGRLSSNHPNLQNIPIRTEEGRKIRKGFIPAAGRVFLSADYSQIELRILAHFSNDPMLKKAFIDGQDIHRYTASLIFHVDQDDVTQKMRETAKTVNFGVIYGMSPFGLSKALGISQEAAKDFIDSYFERYAGVRTHIDRTIDLAKKHGFVETLMKRRRYIPDINSKNPRMRQFAERTAVNAPLQGTASDLIKVAMIEIQKNMACFSKEAAMLIQVHDDLVFEVTEKHLGELARLVKTKMEGALKLSVPLEVSLKSGKNWRDMEPLKL